MANGDNGDPNAGGALAPTGAPTPTDQASGNFDYAFGDSLAVQQIHHHMGGVEDAQFKRANQPLTPGATAGVGDTPQRVLARLNALLEKNPDMFRGKNIFLSPGTSNNASQMDAIKQILARFHDAGAANVVVPGVGPGKDGDTINSNGGETVVNTNLYRAVRDAKWTYYMPNLSHGWDSAQLIHPNNVPEMFAQASSALRQARTAAGPTAEPQGAPDLGATPSLRGPGLTASGVGDPLRINPFAVAQPTPGSFPAVSPAAPGDTSGLRVGPIGTNLPGTPLAAPLYDRPPGTQPRTGDPDEGKFLPDGTPVAVAKKFIRMYEPGHAGYNAAFNEKNGLPQGYTVGPNGFPEWKGNPVGDMYGPEFATSNSSAAGMYQFERSTWNPIAAQLGITDFSPESQERVATYALTHSGMGPWAPWNKNLRAAYQQYKRDGTIPDQPEPADYQGYQPGAYYEGDTVPGSPYKTGGALSFVQPQPPMPGTPGGGGGGGGMAHGGGQPVPPTAQGQPPTGVVDPATQAQLDRLKQQSGFQNLALAMSFLKPIQAPIVNYNPGQVFQPSQVHFSSNPVEDNIVGGGGGLSSMYMRFRPEQVPGYLFSQG